MLERYLGALMGNGLPVAAGNRILISVVIDAYNYGHYIDDAIKSALRQSLARENFEIIVIDDGSTDDTRQRVAQYGPEVIYHFQKNAGQAAAFNAGIACARGEFVAFLDADDYWAPEKLDRVLAKFNESEDIGVVYHTLRLVDHENSPKGFFPKWFGTVNACNPIDNFKQWPAIIGSATSGIAWRVSALRQILPVPEEFRICADAYLMIGAPLVAKEFGLINEHLGFYRIHGNNNYSIFDKNFESSQPKTLELGADYNKLFLKHLRILATKFNCADIPVIKELTVNCFRDEILDLQKSSGTVAAIRLLCRNRALSCLETRYRVYRRAIIVMQLFIPTDLYDRLYQRYLESFLWGVVQKYIKNTAQVTATAQLSEIP